MNFFEDSSVRVLKLADWLNKAAGRDAGFTVALPMIQRGFVWKPSQVIDLWDSLFQGMPIGTLMIVELPEHAPSVPLCDADRAHTLNTSNSKVSLGLVDGQQRTLAMLMGWSQTGHHAGTRLWVDFGDEPPPGHALRLRVTTNNQPYGYRRDDPNARLSMDDRRCASAAYGQAPSVVVRPHPAGAKLSLALELSDLVRDRLDESRFPTMGAWVAHVWSQLDAIEVVDCRGGEATLKRARDALGDDKAPIRAQVDQRVRTLALGLEKMRNAEISLLRVDPEFFNVQDARSIEPPLARLFSRIGSNATPLSNADYVYSVLKYLFPEVHEMVETLHGRGNVASMLTSTDLVMSALRLRAAAWDGEADRDNPSKEDFHRMVWPKGGDGGTRQDDLKQMLDTAGAHGIGRFLTVVQVNLEFRDGDNACGLPGHMFPYLGRPLVQVLLRMAQLGYLQDPPNPDSRAEALRLALYWMQWVFDKPKASRIAFKTMRDATTLDQVGWRIYSEVVGEGAGLRIHAPASIERLGLAGDMGSGESSGEYAREPIFSLRGASRFATGEQEPAVNRQVREFYRHWWRSWNFRHPMLLWLQRCYVSGLPGNPLAGREEDTAYDFDHILPQSHWGDWTGNSPGSRLLDLQDDQNLDAYRVLGNAIGNVRVWDASSNRSDGDASPKVKMYAHAEGGKDWATRSAIEAAHVAVWIQCSPESEDKKKIWTQQRASAFQRAVEMRTFDLYVRFYSEPGFDSWIGS